MNFGTFIRFARERAGLTQAEVADAIGHTEDSISKIERGINGTTLSSLQRMAEVFGVQVGDLMPHSMQTTVTLEKMRPLADLLDALHPGDAEVLLANFTTMARVMLSIYRRKA